jgi:UDP-N-acetylenolpyruvoylglucosamine reductase
MNRELPSLFGRAVRRIHCVGVGGMGVGPLAIYLARLGYAVTGEDDAMTGEMQAQLARSGVAIGPMGADCDLVAYSSAISPQHAAYATARERGLPLVRRGELLAEATRGRKLVAICGSHGKTTTTAMLITGLRAAGFPAGHVLGGLFGDESSPADAGANEWVIAEIDESDGTIDRFFPEITVAVNLDWDHPDRYRSLADIETAFAGLFQRTGRAVLVCDTCAMSARVVKAVGAPRAAFHTFGRGGEFSGEIAAETPAGMELRLGGRFALQHATVRAWGDFNASNATAALAAAEVMGVRLSPAALAAYPAVRRRQSILCAGDFTVVEDYAHHPAEIRALLGSLRKRVGVAGAGRAGSTPGATTGAGGGVVVTARATRGGPPVGRLIVIFQPHRYSRTAQFKAEFADVLAEADAVHLLDVYSAGEGTVAGGTTADLLGEMNRKPEPVPVMYHRDDSSLHSALNREVRDGDLVAFVGAGDIDKKARHWLTQRNRANPLPASPSHPEPRQTGQSRDEPRHQQAMWDAFVSEVKPRLSPGAKLRREEPLAARTTMRVGGAARVYAEPASVGDLQTVLGEAAARDIAVFALGRGSNLIVPDDGVDGVVISLADEAWTTFEPRAGGLVWAGAGLRLKNLCGLAAKAGLVGFEFLEGIPGSVGGALRMNAGAMGGWIFDVVEEVQLMTLAGEVKTLAKAAMHVDYRHCAELQHAIALGALLRPASQAHAADVKRQMDAYARKRHESQPREPSAGCIFKNPPGNSAGRLIDECGLKGERVGDAEVSPVHANFIVNRGQATSADVLELVRRVRARVKQAKGVELQPEVLLYGQRWEDVL